MKDEDTIRGAAQAAGRRRGGAPVPVKMPASGHALPLPSSEKSLCDVPGASNPVVSGASIGTNRVPAFFSLSDLAARWRVSRSAVYGYLRGHPVIDFAPAPGRRGHKIVSVEVVRRIERERERMMR